MPVQARILLLVQVNCPNVETICLTIKTNAQEVIWVSKHTPILVLKFRSPDINLISITTQISRTTVSPLFVHQNLLTFKIFWQKSKPDLHIHTHTPQSYSCIYDCDMQDRPKLWWRLRPDHLVSYSTLQDPIILSLTQPYKTRSSCILLNLTRPNHLVSYSTLQDLIILSLTQPYKTRSSCILINLTRPDHLVSYSTLQDPIILSFTQPYKTRSSCILLNVT